MPKARARALGPSSSKAGPGVPSGELWRASAGHAAKDRDPGRAWEGGGRTAACALAEVPPPCGGQADWALARSVGSPARQAGRAWLESADAKCFQAWAKRRGRRLLAPGRAVSRPRWASASLDTWLGPPWASVSSPHRTRQSHEQGFLGHETQLCPRNRHSSRCLIRIPTAKGHEVTAAVHEGRQAAGHPSPHRGSLLTGLHPRPPDPEPAAGPPADGRMRPPQ